MKKNIITLLAIGGIIMLTTANAQNHTTWMTKTTFGLRGGVNFQNITGKYDGNRDMKNSIIPGFNAGVNLEIPVARDFYIQPGLLLTTRGAKYDEPSILGYERTARLTYLELPVNFVYKPALGAGHLIIGFGPYGDLGLGGKITYEGTAAPGDKDVKFQKTVSNSENGNDAYYKKTGAGANLLFGYEFANKLSFQLNTQLGLTNIYPENDTRPDAKHVGFGISAGYRF